MSDPRRKSDDATGAYTPATRPQADARFTPGELLAGRYRIVAPLGKGGMGEVYRADDLTLGQPVALKFLPQHLAADSDRLSRFRKEVAAARKVSHPHVCRVYDIADHAGQPFLTMEYVDGEDLSSLLKRVGRLPEEKGIEIARQLCGALAAVHDQGLLHRDLKPANVMLDGRGNVRLTDFGLAATAQDLSATEARSGTPLYQAPEQLAGKEVTARTDVYALGLVLYELFTGKRPFPGSERETPPSKPSSHVTGLNPAVERVILRCLEPGPASRPRSAYEVLAGLPGGDPLQAALARGETPSPQLVADAPVEGTLRPGVAGALLAVAIGGLLLIALLADRFKAYRQMPLPDPVVLERDARTIIAKLGYTDPPADFGGGFNNNRPYLRHVVREGRWADERQHLAAARPAAVMYWYRQSPQPLVAGQFADRPRSQERQLWTDNPPHDVPGMVMVRVDTRSRLVSLIAVPDPAAGRPAAPAAWDDLLRAAELDAPGLLRPAENDSIIPPVYADRTAAWEGAYPERPNVPIRVEAGSYRGRPVYFRITHTSWEPDPWSDAPGAASLHGASSHMAEVVLTTVLAGVLMALVGLAVQNLRLGRADVRGAVRLAGTMSVLGLFIWLFDGGHVADLPMEYFRFLQHLGVTTATASILAINYLALEPVMRRRCPHRLTSLARVLAGRWRDPLVGRDVLIGLALGVVSMADTAAFPFGLTENGPIVLDSPSFTRPGWNLIRAMATSIGVTWAITSVFLVLSLIVRRDWIAALLLAVLLVTVAALPATADSAWTVPGGLLRVAAVVFLLLRVGVLALIAWSFVAYATQLVPLTLDPSAWYRVASLTKMLAIAGLAAYGAWASVGGRPVFGKGLLGED
ncbi:MAG TPA: serine/threonine-protein kinase [Gemmataceae bacterium]|nr:serine/threonine-protein kinase [Gemmataceae bacterium]